MRSHARLGLLVAALSSIILACSSGGGSDGPSCKGLDAACTAASDCCAGGTCSVDGVCVPGTCKPLDSACASPLECCDGACSNGQCVSPDTCNKVSESCSVPGDCCTDQCAGGVCVAPPGQCVDPGQACTANGECCTGACVSGKCGDSPNPSCMDKGASCSNDEQCCSLNCVSGKCTKPFCTAPGNTCDADGECCSLNCLGEGPGKHGTCDGNACVPAGSPAPDASRCCSKVWAGGVCQELGSGGTNYTCTTLGESCGASYECCSRNCQGGTCIPAYTCNAPGDICTRPEDCCSGMCSPGASATTPGRCVAPNGGCTQDGVPCAGASNCCTRKCVDLGSGATVCRPAGGCRMTGEYCNSTGACCGGTNEAAPGTSPSTYDVFCDGGTPGSGKNDVPPEFDTSSKNDRTCSNGTSCNPPGNICGAFGDNASQNCCVPGDFNGSGKIVCKLDANDIPRCFGSPPGGGTGTKCPTGYDGSNPDCCIQQGNVCQFREQCCDGSPCVPDASGVLRCATSTAPTCDPRGTQCNPSSPNCCEGTTCKPAGDLGYFCTDASGNNGQCVIRGGGCTSSGQCCSGTTCNQGICDWAASCVPADASCTVDSDCCSGLACDITPPATSGFCKAPVSGPTCSQSGQACAVNTDCCNAPSEVCVEGVCAPPPPLCGGLGADCAATACCQGLRCDATSKQCAELTCAATGTACTTANPSCCEAGATCRNATNLQQACSGGTCVCTNMSVCVDRSPLTTVGAPCAPTPGCCDTTGTYCAEATSIKPCDATMTSCVCKRPSSG